MLTRRQHDLLVFIRDYMAESGGVSPSYEDMMDAMGYASKSRIFDLIKCLEEREFIRHLPNQARSIEILKSPDGVQVGRRKLTPAETVEIVLRQIEEGYFTTYTDANGIETFALACVLSRDPIKPGDKIELEHMTALGIGGRDDLTNIRVALKKHSDIKTNGPGHTSVGGDKHKIAHGRRMKDKHEGKVKPKGTIRSRGFPKNLRKKMNGKVEWV